MKKTAAAAVFAACALLCACTSGESSFRDKAQIKPKTYSVYYIPPRAGQAAGTPADGLRGVWVSQFDMHPVFRTASARREERDYCRLLDKMLDNVAESGFNTVFLQVRPNGDSMYESDYYPMSKYISGVYGGEAGFDALEIFVSRAKERGISVHAWINPFRLCAETDMKNYKGGCILKEWYDSGSGRIKRGGDGLLYLDPSYPEATDLIAAGANEILSRYDFDGLHIDDYFYPTEFELDDSDEFEKSGYDDLGEFRRDNINRTVNALYETAHAHGKVFGAAPAGNIYSLEDGWYADIYEWCAVPGYIDYVMPQLYFGFKNACCPFEQVLADWEKAVTAPGVALYIGVSAAKCAMGSEGLPDEYAGADGRFEWRDEKDILSREIALIGQSGAGGYCVFTYSSLFDPVSGDENPLSAEEAAVFRQISRGISPDAPFGG